MWVVIVPQSCMLGTLVYQNAPDLCVQDVARGKLVGLVWAKNPLQQFEGREEGLRVFLLEIDNQRTQEAIWIM